MPILGPDFASASYSTSDVALVEGDTFVLRRRQPTGAYHPQGQRAAHADVLLPPMSILGLSDLFSFTERAVIPKGTSVGYQIGLAPEATPYDGTLLYWGGTSWDPAGGEAFSPASDVDAHFPDLLAAGNRGKRLQIRIRLSSDPTRSLTPKVRPPSIGCEIEHRPYEDIRRSLREFVVEHIAAQQRLIHRPDDVTAEIEIDTDLVVSRVLHVYNIDDDPDRQTDLLVAANGKRLQLSSPQEAAANLEVVYVGAPETRAIWAAPADPTLFVAKIPAISIVLVRKTRDFRFSNSTEQSISRARGTARVRWAPDLGYLTAEIRCLSQNDAEATNWAERVVEMFQSERCTYLPTGEPMDLVSIGPFMEDDIMARPAACKQVDVTLRYRRWHDDFDEVPLVRRVRVFLSSGGESYEERVLAEG
jgi:hypothetical protein